VLLKEKFYKCTVPLFFVLILAVGLIPESFSNDHNLIVTPEIVQSGFMYGFQVVEVKIEDSDISDINEAKGEPDVTVNGKILRMAQGVDGNWYGYFANKVGAQIADQSSISGGPGTGMDFGYFCSSSSSIPINVFSFSDINSIALPVTSTVPGSQGTAPVPTCSGAVTSGNHNNVVKDYVSLNPGIGLVTGIGQIGILDSQFWPFVQLYNFEDGDDIFVQYNKGGGFQTENFTFLEQVPSNPGDIIIADNLGRLLRVTSLGNMTEIVTGLTNPFAVAIQSNGNVITTETSGRLLSVPLSGGSFDIIADSGLGQPVGAEIDSDGNFIVVDNLGRLLKVTPQGDVSVIASEGLNRGIIDLAIDGDGNYIVTESIGNLLKVTPNGVVTTIADNLPFLLDVEIDSLGNFLVISNNELLRISPDANIITPISPIPGQPFGIAIISDESFLVTDQTGNLFGVDGGLVLVADNLGQPVFLEIVPPTNHAPICEEINPNNDQEISFFDQGIVVTSSSSTTITNIEVSPFHKTVEVFLSGITDVDGDPISLTINAITQDEPTSGLGKSNKSPDGFILESDTALIRAERDGKGDGRVYEVSFTAEDGNGGMCSNSRLIGVPHDSNNDPIDSGQIYDSTLP